MDKTGRNGESSHWLRPAVILLIAVVLPASAMYKLARAIGWQPVGIYLAAVSLITLYLYGADKRKARLGTWRIPESTLHLLELLGGWTAAFLGQRMFRHKVSKVRYQVTFWTIAILHQCLAFDYLRDWQTNRWILQFLKTYLTSET